jgi:formylglycine-generating enzyme required for sulfatase activity
MLKIALCAALGISGVFAQTCIVTVKVLGRNGGPEVGATVTLEYLRFKNDPVRRSRTDRRGEGLFATVNAGPIRLKTDGAEPIEFECAKPYIFSFSMQIGEHASVAPVAVARTGDENLPRRFTNSVGMTFILVPAGSFLMGRSISCPQDNPYTRMNEFEECLRNAGVGSEEFPAHRVTITRPFYLSATELTQEQHVAITGRNQSTVRGENVPEGDSRKYPADRVDGSLIERLNEREHTQSYRLPTEAEWLYAATAGGTLHPGVDYLIQNEWVAENSSIQTLNRDRRTELSKIPHPVAQKHPNPWGFYDMWGNMLEMVSDRFRRGFTPADIADPVGRPYNATPRNALSTIYSMGGSYETQASRITAYDRPSSLEHVYRYTFRLVKQID